MKIANAFSLNMLPTPSSTVSVAPISLDGIRWYLERDGVESFVGHQDTAAILSDILGVEVPVNRGNLQLKRGERMIVAQYKGPRLPEGAKTLPEGAEFQFMSVTVSTF